MVCCFFLLNPFFLIAWICFFCGCYNYFNWCRCVSGKSYVGWLLDDLLGVTCKSETDRLTVTGIAFTLVGGKYIYIVCLCLSDVFLLSLVLFSLCCWWFVLLLFVVFILLVSFASEVSKYQINLSLYVICAYLCVVII